MAIPAAGLIDKKILFLTLGAGLWAYALLFMFLYLKQDSIIEEQEARLPSRTVQISVIEEQPAIEVPPVEQPTTTATPSFNPLSENPVGFELPEPSTAGFPETVPLPGLTESSTFGPLPVIRSTDRLRPFDAYKYPHSVIHAGPAIALVLRGLGKSDDALDSALRTMPEEITFALSPYALDIKDLPLRFFEHGHEFLLEVPFEPVDFPKTDPGPHVILSDAPVDRNLEKLHWVLAQASGYMGVLSSYDSRLLEVSSAARPVLGDIYKRGLLFADGSTFPQMQPETIALGFQAPYARVDIHLDASPVPADIAASLADLERLALDQGRAVGMFSAQPASYREVMRWVESLPAKGITLIPLSKVAQ